MRRGLLMRLESPVRVSNSLGNAQTSRMDLGKRSPLLGRRRRHLCVVWIIVRWLSFSVSFCAPLFDGLRGTVRKSSCWICPARPKAAVSQLTPQILFQSDAEDIQERWSNLPSKKDADTFGVRSDLPPKGWEGAPKGACWINPPSWRRTELKGKTFVRRQQYKWLSLSSREESGFVVNVC